MRGFRDRDQIGTREGLLFTVVGNVHPEDKVISYLKYIPDSSGKWGRPSARYRRALQHYTMPELITTIDWLKEHYPEYVGWLQPLGFEFSAVPKAAVKGHYLPERRLAELEASRKRDVLEHHAHMLCHMISGRGQLDATSLGITGSLLVRIHDPGFSDIDVVVYGRKNSRKAKLTLLRLFEEAESPVRRLDEEELRKWVNSRMELQRFKREDAMELGRRKWDRGSVLGSMFSVHAVKTENEVGETYGDRTHHPLGIHEIEATIVDSSDSLFMPATYQVEAQCSLAGETKGIKQVVSYEGLYSGVFQEGERILVRGLVERVEVADIRAIYAQIVVGSKEAQGRDFIKILQRSV